MIERPNLKDETILASLLTRYHLSATDLTFLPLGADARAGVYRVTTTDGTRYFLKIKQGALNEPGLFIPHYLKTQGIEQVVAPIPTASQTLWQQLDGGGDEGDFSLILYPYVEGRAGSDGGLSHGQWSQLGSLLRQLHTVQLPSALAGQLMVESFVPDWIDLAKTITETLHERTEPEPVAQEMAAFWRQKADLIKQLAVRADALGQRLREQELPNVLCHADIHAGNVMIDSADHLWVVDWDQVVLAPKERDLMFVIGAAVLGPIGEDNEVACLHGYGEGDGVCEIDSQALAYYRYAWAVQDIGAFADEVFGRPDLGKTSKAQALYYFKSLFNPGMIVEAALKSEI